MNRSLIDALYERVVRTPAVLLIPAIAWVLVWALASWADHYIPGSFPDSCILVCLLVCMAPLLSRKVRDLVRNWAFYAEEIPEAREADMETRTKDADRCPQCDAATVLTGYVDYYEESPHGRLDLELNGMRYRTAIDLTGRHFHACLSCGHVWTRVDPWDLRDRVARSGPKFKQHVTLLGLEFLRSSGEARSGPRFKQHVTGLLAGPAHDLPDAPAARAAAGHVAEIDGLVLGHRGAQATRRFRELTGVTWDRAIAVVGRWDELPRAEKLAIFGWALKGRPGAGGDDPLRDREPDG